MYIKSKSVGSIYVRVRYFESKNDENIMDKRSVGVKESLHRCFCLIWFRNDLLHASQSLKTSAKNLN